MSHDYQQLLLCTQESDFNIILNYYKISHKSYEEMKDKLNDWFKKQPHLCHIDLELALIKRFLIVSNFSIENAKEKIDNFFAARYNSSFFKDRDSTDPKLLKRLDILDISVMPIKTKENYRVCFFRITNPDIELFDEISLMKLIMFIGDIRMIYEAHLGDILIYDFANITLNHCLKICSMLKNLLHIIQNCYGTKLKGIHILNCPTFAYNLISFLKSILKEKIANRVYLHKDQDSLHKAIPLEYLPENLGGKQKSSTEIKKLWIEAMTSKEWVEWYKKSGSQTSDETKRIKNYVYNIANGAQGSFRRLDID